MTDQKPPIYYEEEKKALHLDPARIAPNMCNTAELGEGWGVKRVIICKEENGEIAIKPMSEE